MTYQPNASLVELVENWKLWDKNAESLAEITKLADKNEWEKLDKMMSKRLEFGTAGIRGRMGPGFGQMNDLVIIQVNCYERFFYIH